MITNSQIKNNRKLGIWYSENEVFDYGIARHIGINATFVYLALCRHADSDGTFFPFVNLLKQECNLSNKQIAQSTRALKKVGLIQVEHHRNQHNVYRLNSVRDIIQSLKGSEKSHNKQIEIVENDDWDREESYKFWEKEMSTHKPLWLSEDESPIVQFEDIPPTSKTPTQSKNRIRVEDCPFCDERGMLRLVERRTGSFYHTPCNHKKWEIKALAQKKKSKIESAKPGYEYPDSY